MSAHKISLFGSTKALEAQIDELLDKVSEAGIVFQKGIFNFIDHGPSIDAMSPTEQLIDMKHRGGELKRMIETQLYTEMLIPDFRGDVLQLLEHLYGVLDLYAGIGAAGKIEQPQIPDNCKHEMKELTKTAVMTVEQAVMGARAFFRDIGTVRDHTHKTSFYESESDKILARLKGQIFASDWDLARKLHIREYATEIAHLADEAEDIGDALAIYAIKRAE